MKPPSGSRHSSSKNSGSKNSSSKNSGHKNKVHKTVSKQSNIQASCKPSPPDETLTSTPVSPESLRYLGPFIGQECSLSTAAKQLQVAPSTLQYRIRSFLKTGLLQLSSVKHRAGRPIKYYRSSQETLFISFEASTCHTLEDFLMQWHEPWNMYFVRSICHTLDTLHANWGVRVYRTPQGDLAINLACDAATDYDPFQDSEPALLFGWNPQLYLNPEDAKRLQKELSEVLRRYETIGGTQRYILRLALTPAQEDSSPLFQAS